eukprot:4061395-Amphidinium_carterae.1
MGAHQMEEAAVHSGVSRLVCAGDIWLRFWRGNEKANPLGVLLAPNGRQPPSSLSGCARHGCRSCSMRAKA